MAAASELSMGPVNLFVRCIMGLALMQGAVLCALIGPVMAQAPAAQEVRIGLLARKTPPPPTFSFDAIPKDEGFAGARAAIKDNDTTGAFTGHRYVLDEVSLEDDESPVAAVTPLGRRPTLTVLVTCRDFESITEMVSSFSFDT